MDLSIIIVNWNSREYLRQCLASIHAFTHHLHFEILVIDSGSFDGCDVMLREEYPEVRFIQSSRNLGFAGANNAAYRASKGNALLFLNPDTELGGPAINVLYNHLWKLTDVGALGCRLLNSDGTVQTSCIQSIPTIVNQVLDSEMSRAKWPASRLWGMAPLFSRSQNPQEVEAITGACVMLKKKTFEEVGLFSEDYFMYAEDIDLSHKIRKAGYKNYYIPTVEITHHGGSSTEQAVSNFSVVMMREAIWRFMQKTRGARYALIYRAAMFLSACGRLTVLFVASKVASLSVRESAFHKWRAVLCWSINRANWIREYYPS